MVDGTGCGGGFETSRCGASISGQADGIGGVSRGVPGVVARRGAAAATGGKQLAESICLACRAASSIVSERPPLDRRKAVRAKRSRLRVCQTRG